MSIANFRDSGIRFLKRIGLNVGKHGLGVPDGHRGASRANTFLKKALLLIHFFISLVANYQKRKSLLSELKGLKDSYSGEFAYIFGQGFGEDKKAAKQLLTRLEIESETIFVTNHFDQSTFYGLVSPDYWLLMDESVQLSSESDSSKKTWKQILKSGASRVVVPWRFSNEYHPENVIYVDNDSLAGIWKNIKPSAPRGYEGKSCTKALAFADYLGFETVTLIGCDNDYFRKVSLDGTMAKSNELPGNGFIPAKDYFQNLANEFAHLETVISMVSCKVNFLNVDNNEQY